MARLANDRIALRAECNARGRRGVGFPKTDQGGGSGRIGTRGFRDKTLGSPIMRPEAGSAAARAWS